MDIVSCIVLALLASGILALAFHFAWFVVRGSRYLLISCVVEEGRKMQENGSNVATTRHLGANKRYTSNDFHLSSFKTIPCLVHLNVGLLLCELDGMESV